MVDPTKEVLSPTCSAQDGPLQCDTADDLCSDGTCQGLAWWQELTRWGLEGCHREAGDSHVG